jgi:hypothetical protein
MKIVPNDSEVIMLTLTCDYNFVLDKIRKNILYLNEVIDRQTDTGLYIEVIEGGFLYIYKNFEVMNLMNKPFEPYVIHELQKLMIKKDEEDLILKNTIQPSKFPKGGVKIIFTAKTEPKMKVLKVFHSFFKSIQAPNLELKIVNDKLIAYFPIFESFQAYTSAVQSLFPTL